MIDLDAERLWWARTLDRLNVAERARLETLLRAVEQGRAENERLRESYAETLRQWEDTVRERDRLRAALQGIVDACESGDIWEHGIDGDEYNSWTTCEGRWAIQEQAEEALKDPAP